MVFVIVFMFYIFNRFIWSRAAAEGSRHPLCNWNFETVPARVTWSPFYRWSLS